MAVSGNFFDQAEITRRQHRSAIEGLTAELGVDKDTIRALYDRELEKLNAEATIKDFLSIFVMREVRDQIKNKHAIGKGTAP